jgi:hypothetical protein
MRAAGSASAAAAAVGGGCLPATSASRSPAATAAPLPVATSAISVEPGARPAAALPSAAGAGGRNDLRSLDAKRPLRFRISATAASLSKPRRRYLGPREREGEATLLYCGPSHATRNTTRAT